jgi:hypothetical protein
MAYQVAFDIEENATQDFSKKVIGSLPVLPTESAAESNEMQVDESSSSAVKPKRPISKSPLAKLHLILSGQLSIQLHLEFLFRNNKADILTLKNTKVFSVTNYRLHLIVETRRIIQPYRLLMLSKMLVLQVMSFYDKVWNGSLELIIGQNLQQQLRWESSIKVILINLWLFSHLTFHKKV